MGAVGEQDAGGAVGEQVAEAVLVGVVDPLGDPGQDPSLAWRGVALGCWERRGGHGWQLRHSCCVCASPAAMLPCRQLDPRHRRAGWGIPHAQPGARQFCRGTQCLGRKGPGIIAQAPGCLLPRGVFSRQLRSTLVTDSTGLSRLQPASAAGVRVGVGDRGENPLLPGCTVGSWSHLSPKEPAHVPSAVSRAAPLMPGCPGPRGSPGVPVSP